MNRIYKLKFDKRRNELVVVSEITAGMGKEKSTGHITDLPALSPFRKLLGTLTPVSLLTGLISGLLPAMVLAADLPIGGQIVGGQGSISTSGNQMTIHQQTQNMATNWHSFDIGKNNTVQFVQPDSSSVALNRVTGASGSQIMGTLKANGQVFILNPNGVLFGKNARVDVGGLVASTKNISTADFMKGQYTLSGEGNPGAQVINQGSLTTSKGGYIVLAGERVSNSGTVTTPGGKTVLAAGKTVTLQLDNGGLTSVSVNGSVVNALVENRGLISASNGQVYLTAKGQDMLLNTVVNNSGTIEATGLSSRGGEIVLDGGNSGVVNQSGELLADSGTGRGGRITVEGENIHLAGASRMSATGETDGGEIYAGGGWQGKDSGIRNASKVVMDRDSVMDVSSNGAGDGGTAVLWSEDYTNFGGTILARGGRVSGNGGQVETSSHDNLQAFGTVDASAARGQGGNWLLDPTDVTIVGTGSADSGVSNATANGTEVFSPTASGAQILNTSIVNQLNNGTSVTVQTSGMDTSGQSGNITVNADIAKTAGGDAALTLNADGNITLNTHSITSTSGRLDISLLGAGSNTAIVKVLNSTLSSNGGNITLDQFNHVTVGSDGSTATNPNAMTVKVDNSTLNASASGAGQSNGNITINAYNPNVNLSQSAYNTTVRNGGSTLEVSGGSSLLANNIFLNSVQSGEQSRGLPVFINGATLTADQDITFNGLASNGSQAAQMEIRGRGNTLTAGGNILLENLGGGSRGIYLNGSSANAISLSAKNNITLHGEGGTAAGVAIANSSITADNKINITGNTTGYSGDGNSPYGGIYLFGTVNFKAKSGELTGSEYSKEHGNAGGIVLGRLYIGQAKPLTSILFDGSFNINGISKGSAPIDAGIYYNGNTDITFSGGNSVLNGTGYNESNGIIGVFDSSAGKRGFSRNIILKNNANLNVNLKSDNATSLLQVDGSDSNTYSVGFVFSGQGNVSINAHNNSSTNASLRLNLLDNTKLSGNFSVNAVNDTGNGVEIPGYINANLINATINGSSGGSGAGVIINETKGRINFGNNSVTGISKRGDGINIKGSNVNLTGGTLNGTSVSGAGVRLTGVSNYVLDSITVNGISADGPAIVLSGNITQTNVTLNGNTM
ncbi:TPA: filamentous hemagglutinin N-terminal domain-containing protein, partial [Salmonella enterica subsp. enterica serovar Muenchen]